MNDAPATPSREIATEIVGLSLMGFVAQAVKDPTVDVSKLKALLEMQRELLADDAKAQFIRAMRDAQAEIQPVVRDAENTQTRSMYAKLETVDAAIRPIYTAHGFSPSFDEEPGDGTNMLIVCELLHIAGHAKKYRLHAPPDTMGPKGAPTKTMLHGRGSTITFLRRYLLCNIFNVVLRNQDDDGKLAGTKFVTTEQAAEIDTLLRETKSDAAKFLHNYFEVTDVRNLTADQYTPAKNMLLAKKKRSEG